MDIIFTRTLIDYNEQVDFEEAELRQAPLSLFWRVEA